MAAAKLDTQPADAPAKPAMPGTLKFGMMGAAVLLGLAAFVFFVPKLGGDPDLAKLEKLVEAANTACASNSDVENAAKVGADLSLLMNKIKGEGGITEYRKKYIGADKALPPELQLPENAQIRKCMSSYMPGIFKAIGIDIPAPAKEDFSDAFRAARGTITQPRDQGVVKKSFEASGTAHNVGEGVYLWLAVEINDSIWPKEGKVIVDNNGQWSLSVFEDGRPDQFGLSLWTANPDANVQLRAWLDRALITRVFPALQPLPGMKRLARVQGLHVAVDR